MEVLLNWLQKRWVYHSLIWLFILGVVVMTFSMDITGPDYTAPLIMYAMAELMLVVYGNFYLVDRFFKKRDEGRYFLVLVLFIVAIYYVDKLLIWLFFSSVEHLIALEYSEIIGMIVLSVIARSFKQGIASQYKLTELQAKTAEMELNSLKTQINPHFLFNNLNNIYAINQIDSEKGSEMILELADVMRYHLQFSKQKEVSLADEIQLVKSYIELEKLRLNENCDLQISISNTERSPLIAPLLLLPFIENAFKHGTHPKEQCFVHLSLFLEGQRLHFELSNSVIRNKNVVKTNIGINNTVKRLELLYPQKHKLQITPAQERYTVKLELDLRK